MRLLIEVIHIALGLIAAMVIASLAAWSYPRATDDIWLVAYACMAAVVVMGLGPVRRAWAYTGGPLAPKPEDSTHG